VNTTLDHPRDPRAEGLFLAWNLSYELVDLPLDQVQQLAGAQVRGTRNIAPSEGVDEYATHMRAGAVFPPIVVTTANVLLDGNTRLGAARRNGATTFPAYVLNVPNIEFAKAVAGALNQQNGRRLTAEEAQHTAVTMLRELRFTDEQVGAAVGRSAQMVRNWRVENEVAERARRQDLAEVIEPISRNQRHVLHRVKLDQPSPRSSGSSPTPDRGPGTSRRWSRTSPRPAARPKRCNASPQPGPSGHPSARNPGTPRPTPRPAAAGCSARRLLKMAPSDLFDAPRAADDRTMWAGIQQLATQAIAVIDLHAATDAA